MIDLTTVKHHKAIEDITQLICTRVQNMDAAFFRPIVAYHMMVTAATMRAKVVTLDRGEIPINGYVIALSTSGSGKGYSSGMLENNFFGDFRKTFTQYVLPKLAEGAMWKHAMHRAGAKGTEEQVEYDKLVKEYEALGEYIFAFDEGHPASIKQVRDKLLISQAGSINFVVDEIGSNLEKIAPAIPLFLELYDQGFAKQKLYMSNNERKRTAQIEGKTPANMLLFGTQHKLFDGSSAEDTFYSMLETGLARRSLFSIGHPKPANWDMATADIFDALCDPAQADEMQAWSDHFATLADETKYGWVIDVPRDVGIELLDYKHNCEGRARDLPEHSDVRHAELTHRYFKCLKLAGAFAFIEEAMTMTPEHLHAAMKLVEESGDAFQSILSRERPYMKLARYIATSGAELTHADLTEELPFYKPGQAFRNEIMMLATAWGYRQHIVIKQRFVDGVEFFSGEALAKTDLENVHLAHSDHFAENYSPETAPFTELHNLTTLPDYNWTAHSFKNDHRLGDNVIPGFDLAVFDIDGTASLELVHQLLEDYTFMTYTTKRHTPAENRFRLVMPLSYFLKLDKEDYGEFMKNLADWLPFDVDVAASKDQVRKWATYEHADVHYNEGKLLDVLPFIPRTKRNEERAKAAKKLVNLGAMERWIIQKVQEDGSRNNHLLRYALSLVDQGYPFATVQSKLESLDDRLPDPLGSEELQKTILVTVAKKLQNVTP